MLKVGLIGLSATAPIVRLTLTTTVYEERAQPGGRDNALTGAANLDVGLPLDGAFSLEENRRPRTARVSLNVRHRMKRSPRYLLLPTWIRLFAWIFLFIGAPGFVVTVFGLIFNFTFPVFIFGLRSVGPLRTPVTFVIGATFALLAYAAFALLWGRKDGRQAGLAAGYIGLAICALVSFATFSTGGFYIPLEPVLQIPFIWKLHKLKGCWEEEPNQAAQTTPGLRPSVSDL